ncbi:hypothetical protein [Endozoicomonas elysicola]|nr:hypothetical protein [Endozoicomonas elysicola]
MFNSVMGAAKNVGGWLYEASTQAAFRIGNAFTRLVKSADVENQLKQWCSHSEMSSYSLADFCIKSVGSFEVVSWTGSKAQSNQSEQHIDFNKPVPGLKEAMEDLDVQAKKLEKTIDKRIKDVEKQELLDNIYLQRSKIKPLGNWREEIQARTKARTEARLARRTSNIG